jgi:hypothetical protein
MVRRRVRWRQRRRRQSGGALSPGVASCWATLFSRRIRSFGQGVFQGLLTELAALLLQGARHGIWRARDEG